MESAADRQAARALYQTAQRYHALAPWQLFTDDQPFQVLLPGHAHPLLASIHGAGGQHVGMGVFRGPHAARIFDEVQQDIGIDYENVLLRADMISLDFGPFREVPEEFRTFYAEAGERPRFSTIVPLLWAKEPHRQMRALTPGEQADFALLLSGVVHAVERRLLTPEVVLAAAPGQLLTLRVSGDPAAPRVSVGEEPVADEPEEQPPMLFVDPATLAGLPRLRERWIVGCPPIPARVGGSDQMPRLALVVDRASEQVLDAYAVMAPRAAHQAAARLIEVFQGKVGRGQPGLPELVLCTSDDLGEVLAPVLASCGVAFQPAPELASLPQQIARDFLDFADELPGAGTRRSKGDEERGGRGPGKAQVGAATTGRDALPAPDDFPGWRAAAERLIKRCTREAHIEPRERPSLLGSFFGDTAAALELVGQGQEQQQQNALIAFIEWCWLDRRKGGGRGSCGETLAERQLRRGGLPAAERTLLEAMVAEPVSLYRVGEIEPGQWLEMEDLLRGGKIRLHDRALSGCAVSGMALAARLFPAGSFHFETCVGPPIAGWLISQAMAFLSRQGLKTTPAALAHGAQYFGRLWLWAREQPARPTLYNTDSELLRWHAGEFELDEPATVRRALARRPDVSPGDEEMFIWQAPHRPSSPLPGPTTLASLRLEGSRLTADANSHERWKRLLSWLTRLPGGVRLVRQADWSVEEQPPAWYASAPGRGQAKKSDAADFDPEEASEVRELLAQRLREHRLRWVDKSVPALGGRTPRQAVQTAEGRRQVQQLLRTLAPTIVEGGEIAPPVEELRSILGLPPEPDRPGGAAPGGSRRRRRLH